MPSACRDDHRGEAVRDAEAHEQRPQTHHRGGSIGQHDREAGEEKHRRLQEKQDPQSEVYIGQLSSRKAESQNIHSSWVALAKAACIRVRRDDEAASAASSVAAIMARTALWNSSPA